MEINILNIKYLTVKNADHLENIISSVMFLVNLTSTIKNLSAIWVNYSGSCLSSERSSCYSLGSSCTSSFSQQSY
jgi:hypothetical protein